MKSLHGISALINRFMLQSAFWIYTAALVAVYAATLASVLVRGAA